MRRLLTRSITILFLAALLALGAVSPAHADSDDDSITRMQIDAALQSDGSMKVTLDFDFDFGSDEGHGPYLTLPERMEIEGDPDHWRSLPISDITASSDSAPADVQTERESGAVLIKIGDEDVEVEGTHAYRVGYTIGGVVNPEAAGSGLDELSWNPIGTGWEIPLRDVAVSVTTPADIERVACFTGSDYQTPCGQQPTFDGTSASFAPGHDLEPGDGMQIVAGMPAGSFPGVQPIIIERYSAGRVLGLDTPLSGVLGGVILALGAAAAIIGVRRKGGDRQFADVTPGLIPPAGADAPQTRAQKNPIAVQFQPPKGVLPGQVGVLDDATADQKDVTATVIDLATRGYLRIEEKPETKKKKGWQLVSTGQAPVGLRPYESKLLNTLFEDGDQVDLDEAGVIAAASTECQKGLYQEVTDIQGWFRGNPSSVRTRWVLAGLGVLVLGIALLFLLGFTLRLGLVGIGVALVGVALMIAAHWAPGRTAVGTAVLIQARGFREYLETAEADQIRFEEGVDIFSRYLPYAMIWGLAERWTKIFADLAARGTDLPEPSWYVGVTPVWAFAGSGSFADAISGFDSAATSAMTSASSSSGGGSGFSGGGGVGGGGGGGW